MKNKEHIPARDSKGCLYAMKRKTLYIIAVVLMVIIGVELVTGNKQRDQEERETIEQEK